MKKTWLSKKLVYVVAVLIIIIGMIVTYLCRTNFSLEYAEHTRIDLYLDKSYEMKDIKQIGKEVFGEKEVIYQKIETFNDAVALNVKDLTEEERTSLEQKIREKYEISEDTNILETTQIGHLRVRDLVKPYIIPMIMTTLIILAYVGIRYINLGVFKTIFTLFIRLVLAQGVFVGILEITRLPIGSYIIPVGLGIYFITTIATVAGYEKELGSKKQEDEKKKA